MASACSVGAALICLALPAQASAQQAPPPALPAANPAGIPGAVPPSVPAGMDPGQVPTVPIFGPHSPDAGVPAAEGTPPPASPEPRTDETGAGFTEDDIRAYVVPEMDLTPIQTEPGGAIWERNASVAFHKAKTLQRPLLLLFTAQWNSACQKLSEEVFTSNSFNEFAREYCVICFVDYPQNLNEATPSMLAVKEKFQIRGFPNLLIFDPDGNVVRQMNGYRPGRPVAYFTELHEIVEPLCLHLEDRRKQLMDQGYRDWSNGTGTTVFAIFDSHNGEKVMLRGPAGDRWVFPISTLSADDQALVRSFPTWAELNPEAVIGEQ